MPALRRSLEDERDVIIDPRERSMVTRYADYDDDMVYLLFATNVWGTLSADEKLDACQELEIRYANARGVAPVQVDAAAMEGGAYGYYDGDRIVINSHLLESNPEFVVSDVNENGEPVMVEVAAPASNFQMMDTIIHEGTHSAQDQEGRLPSTYFNGEKDYDIYRIQGCEKEAYACGQFYTLQAISYIEAKTGMEEPSKTEYVEAIKEQSFDKSLNNAINTYGDENIEETVNLYIYNRDHGYKPEIVSQSYVNLNNTYLGIPINNVYNQSSNNGYDSLDTGAPLVHAQGVNESLSQETDYVGIDALAEGEAEGVTESFDYIGFTEDQSSEQQDSGVDYSLADVTPTMDV